MATTARTQHRDTDEHYDWAVDLMSSLAVGGIVKTIIAAATLGMAFVVTLEMAFGYGATTSTTSAIQWTAMLAAYAMGLFWLFGPWPTRKEAFTFVALANLAIFSATMVADFPPEITLAKSVFLIELGMFVGFFFERWMLAFHTVFCVAAVGAIGAYVVRYDTVPAFQAVVVCAPVIIAIAGFVFLLHFTTRSMRLEFD